MELSREYERDGFSRSVEFFYAWTTASAREITQLHRLTSLLTREVNSQSVSVSPAETYISAW